ncbi:MAG: phosphoribosylformylglycinamidine synthase I [Caldilineaceae bacterium]|nr:phosphoribosylformylglycinamidine synthase I [Caldilineaceae bacterium]
MTKPSILILHASGTNRDAEAARACELAGGAPEIVHMNQLRSGERRFGEFDILLLPGGFSYGDALGAGVRKALDLQVFFHAELHEFVESGKRVLGICNGFQTLVKAGVLPGEETTDRRPQTADVNSQFAIRNSEHPISNIQYRSVTLTDNASGHFECRWVHLRVEAGTRAGFLSGIDELIFCPVAHGEGNFQTRDESALARLEKEALIALRYVDADGNPARGRYPLNPNGSAADIAGICNARGNVVGLMPHPEDHILPIQNPLGGDGRLGLAIFKAMIQE